MLRYKNKKTGEEKEYSSTSKEYTASKIWEDKDWEYKDMVQKVIIPSKNPSIMDFHPSISVSDISPAEASLPFVKRVLDKSQVKLLKILALEYNSEMEIPFEEYDPEGFPAEEYQIVDTVTGLDPNVSDIDIMEGLIAEKKAVVLISRKLETADWAKINELKAIEAECKKNGVPFMMICNATREDINAFRKEYGFTIPVFSMDEIELKIISRSNPALMVLEKGVVKAKYTLASTPSGESFAKQHLKK